MCQATTCSRCGKPTYVGCGAHVEQVLGHVKAEDRCRCREDARAEAGREPSAAAALPDWLRAR